MRILYIHATVQPPPSDRRADRFYWLSDRMEGDVLHPIWFRTPERVDAALGPSAYPTYSVGAFRYHWDLGPATRGPFRKLRTFWFYIREALRLHRERPFDCIVAYSHMTTGLVACVVKLLTGARLVIEVVTAPELVYVVSQARPSIGDRIRQAYSDACLHLSMRIADRAHLLYTAQLSAFPSLRTARRSVFPEFVPVSSMGQPRDDAAGERYILLLGAPWYLKGADIAVAAFHLIADEFPDVKLRIVGHNPDSADLKAMTRGSDRIEISPALFHPDALRAIAGATVMLQPSRCEGTPRAVIEGMAARIPVVASRVGGIPELVRDGETGFLCPVGDVEAFASRLRLLLDDDELRRRMGEAGYRRAHEELNEEVYRTAFAEMIDSTVRDLP